MGKVAGIVTVGVMMTSVAGAQEIGIVSIPPNAATSELVVDLPARPNGEKVFVVRDNKVIAEATVKLSGGQGGTVLALPVGTATDVKVGDRISLSSSIDKPLPESAYRTSVDSFGALPGQKTLAQTVGARTDLVVTDAAPAPPPPVAPAPPAPVGAPEPGPAIAPQPQLEKGVKIETTIRREITAQLTPRSMGVPLYPAPAVRAEAGITAPYGQGLAAAAPVGTPYLRSPAFAGPPIIYMPQTVTRVLLPGATPYPSDIMAPPTQYAYASAPFLRTDIYVSMPYGTYYWPQGYAGTTPVEPQVPAYVTAPATALLTNEATYSAGRYVPGAASAETLNPITSGINSNLIASTSLAQTEAGGAVVSTEPSAVTSIDTLTVATPAPVADVQPFPVLQQSSTITSTETTVESTPGLSPFAPVDAAAPTPVPSLPSTAPAGLPALPAPAPAPAGGLPDLPSAAPAGLPALPAQPVPAITPAPSLPALPVASAAGAEGAIVVDDQAPGAVEFVPASGGWEKSQNQADSHQQSSFLAKAEGAEKTATFKATVPADGVYDVSLWWVPSTEQFRSSNVPVTIHTATGPQQVPVDQTNRNGGGQQWHSLGTFEFRAGQNIPVATVSTQGVTPGPSISVSVDALKLTRQGQ